MDFRRWKISESEKKPVYQGLFKDGLSNLKITLVYLELFRDGLSKFENIKIRKTLVYLELLYPPPTCNSYY